VLVVSDRDEIVEAARELDAGTLTCAGKSVRYEQADDRELAAAIDIISAHGCPDELTGDREHGCHGARIGRYVLWSDPQRVAALQTFANQRAASVMLKLGGVYLAGNTEHRSNGVRVGRYVLWRDDDAQEFAALQPYANERSASGALMFGLLPGAGDGYDQSPSGVVRIGSPRGSGAGNSHGGDVAYGVYGEADDKWFALCVCGWHSAGFSSMADAREAGEAHWEQQR
jgi:hypothetical protein